MKDGDEAWRCNLYWYSGVFGLVQCVHPRGVHIDGRHEAWNPRSWIAVGIEHLRPMGCFWGGGAHDSPQIWL